MKTTDRRFDHAVQSRYADAVANISPRTRAQLRNRLHSVTKAPETARVRRPAWGLAAVVSLMLAVVIGLQLRTPEPPGRMPVVGNASADNGELLASLDEAPDLYLWLASDEASALVSE